MAAQKQTAAKIKGDAPVIDVSLIPEHEIDQLCRTLLPAVKKLFEDPAVQEDFEKWKAERAARKQQADQNMEVRACSM